MMAALPDSSTQRWRDTQRWVTALDSSIRIPGTRRRIGWDAIVGLVPGVGDAAGLVLSLVVITHGVQLGVRGWTIARLIVVAAIDAAVGAVPVLGSVFDFVFKANERNLRTVAAFTVDRDRTERRSREVVLVALTVAAVVVLTLTAAAVAVVLWLMRWLG